MVVFDTVARYFRHSGYDLTYVRNITDIDDKIINRALENGEDFNALTERFITAMHEDEQALNVLPVDIEPRATQSIPDIIAMIEKLINNGLAYVGGNGDVFYAVDKFNNYGQLSGKNLADLQAGERVDVDLAKNNPLDFVLWKMAKANEPAWQSPWGNGRPGWHIECSAMSTCCLGNSFDIHGGGMDLQFPHHENEIAQSEGATGEKFVNLWMHNGFVRVDNEKMSKSLGNFFTVREVLKQYRPEVIRFFILSSHYRSPLNYSDESLNEAQTALTRLYTALRGCHVVGNLLEEYHKLETEQAIDDDFSHSDELDFDFADVVDSMIDKNYKARFEQAMDDDFNTPVAVAVLFDIARELNKAKNSESEKVSVLAGTLKFLGGLLGILQDKPDDFLKGINVASVSYTLEGISGGLEAIVYQPETNIEQQIQARIDAKKAKDWATADKIRNDLKASGIILEDAPDGTTSWRRE
jgi:cysteinyl-tRNA synthetase